MLNLSRQEDMLTQGQSPADRVLASPNSPGSPPGDQPGGLPAPGGSPAAGAPDVQLIANRVYELMRQDLLILRERSGYSIGR
jgi:hypothetical protein